MYVEITEAGGFYVYGIIQYGDEDGKRLYAEIYSHMGVG